MSASGLLVEKSGPLSLIQDFGRFGLAHIGITQGGPVDDYAYSWANHLLGNRVNCSAIEKCLFCRLTRLLPGNLWRRSECISRWSPYC